MIKTVLTNAGLALRQKTIAEKGTMEFTRAKLGSGKAVDVDAIAGFTDVLQYEIDAQIKLSRAVNAVHELVAVIDNANVAKDFVLYEIGIFAKEGMGKEILYSYTYVEHGEYMPNKDTAKVVREWVVNTGLSQSEQVEIKVDDSRIYATMGDLDELKRAGIIDEVTGIRYTPTVVDGVPKLIQVAEETVPSATEVFLSTNGQYLSADGNNLLIGVETTASASDKIEIKDLPVMSSLKDGDSVLVNDSSGNTAKRVTAAQLKGYANNGTSAPPVPDYITTAIPHFVKAVNADRRASSMVFMQITDTHAGPFTAGRYDGLYAFAEVARQMKPDFCVHGGDWAQDNATGAPALTAPGNGRYISHLDILVDIFKDMGVPFFPTFGNHDTGLGDDTAEGRRVFPLDFFRHVEIPFQSEDMVRNYDDAGEADKSYYYYDFPNKRVRVICTNTSDLPESEPLVPRNGWGAKQLKWLAEKALTVPAGWGVILFGHAPPISELSYLSGGSPQKLNNGDPFNAILSAFASGGTHNETLTGVWGSASIKADYRSRGEGNIIAYVSGHVHADNKYRPEGLPYTPICFAANLKGTRAADTLPPGAESPPRSSSDITNICLSACVYHPEDETIHVFRLGAPSSVFSNGSPSDITKYPAGIVNLSGEATEEPPVINLGATTALRLRSQPSGGTFPFGNDMPVSALGRIEVGFKILEFDNSSTANYLQFICAGSSGTNQRFYVGFESRLRPYLGFGEKSSQNGGAGTELSMNTDYDITAVIENGGTVISLYNGDALVVSSATDNGVFSLKGSLLFNNKSHTEEYNINMLYYYLKIYDAAGNPYAIYDFQDGTGNIARDSSGNNRNMPLSGEYEWVEIDGEE